MALVSLMSESSGVACCLESGETAPGWKQSMTTKDYEIVFASSSGSPDGK
jgi:hypothetical protein